MRSFLLTVLLLFVFTACEDNDLPLPEENPVILGLQGGNGAYSYAKTKEGSASFANTVRKEAEAPAMSPKLIKNGSMGVEVDSLALAKKSVDSLMVQHQAYYGEEVLENQHRRKAYQLKIRIPADRFELFIAALEKGQGKVLYKKVNTQDVSEKYLDLEGRLKSKQASLDRLRELMARAKDMETVLKIENQVRQIEEEIESVTGRLRYLSNQVSYATLDLNLSQAAKEGATIKKDSYAHKVWKALSDGGRAFGSFILLVLNIWPFWLGAIILIFIWQRRKKTKA